jgi:apolipoprotein D and lipocalin family protein
VVRSPASAGWPNLQHDAVVLPPSSCCLNETWTDGRRGHIEGVTWRADPASDEAKLKVRFYMSPFIHVFPITGDYWVLHIDADYQYALVGQPSRKYL